MAYMSYNRKLLGRSTNPKLLLCSPPQLTVAELNSMPVSSFMRSMSFLNQVSIFECYENVGPDHTVPPVFANFAISSVSEEAFP